MALLFFERIRTHVIVVEINTLPGCDSFNKKEEHVAPGIKADYSIVFSVLFR
jgi:hypothetical protein